MNRNYARMFELRDRARLPPETFPAMCSRGERSGDRLERDETIKTDLPREINDRHPTAAEHVHKFVITNPGAGFPALGFRELAYR